MERVVKDWKCIPTLIGIRHNGEVFVNKLMLFRLKWARMFLTAETHPFGLIDGWVSLLYEIKNLER